MIQIPEHVDLVLYHGGCPDGFAAAHIAWKRYGPGRFIETKPVNFGEPVPIDLCTDRDVLVVDFSWKRQHVEALRMVARSFHVFDHHVTAEEELRGIPGCTFDIERSGASLAWDLLFPGQPRPWWVMYVEDRDLWRLVLPDSLAVNAYIMAVPRKHGHWVSMIEHIDSVTALQLGDAIRLHVDHYVEGVLAHRQLGLLAWPDGSARRVSVAVVNAPYLNLSDVATKLLDYAQIGMGWFERGDGLVQFGMRSKDPIDVSAVAKHYGGGGHKHAAGFELTVEKARALLDSMLAR